MRSLLCAVALASLMVGCTQSDGVVVVEDETQTAPAAESEPGLLAEEETPAIKPAVFKVGDAAPTFANLQGVDDKPHSMDEFKDAKALAVVFTCNKCPVAVAYEDRLIAYQKDYADKGVKVVAINVNNAEADKLPAMKTRAEEKGFTFAYLYDPSQKIAREYGAEVTPHVFLLDENRQLAYVGPVDDNIEEAQVTNAYLREATDAVLEGKKPETTEAPPAGCGIQYE